MPHNMAGILEALKKTTDEYNRTIFYGAYMAVGLGLLFNFIGMGTGHWIGAGDFSYGPFETDVNTDIAAIVKSDDVIFMLPVGTIIVVIGDFLIYWFIRKGGEKVWLLRVGGAMVHYGGLLMIIAASLWGAHAKSDNVYNTDRGQIQPKLQYSFALSVTGATLIALAGPIMAFVYRKNNPESAYVSIASSTSSSSRSSSFYQTCHT